MVLRLLDTSSGIYSLDGLGMIKSDIDKIQTIINRPYGMILSTGPTGSGKSTSLYAILNELNKPDRNIMTLEDPVEYRIDNIRQVQLNRKAGMTFASGLRVDPPAGPGHHHAGGDPRSGNGGDCRSGRPDRDTGFSAPYIRMTRPARSAASWTWESNPFSSPRCCWSLLPSAWSGPSVRTARSHTSRPRRHWPPGGWITSKGAFQARQRVQSVPEYGLQGTDGHL